MFWLDVLSSNSLCLYLIIAVVYFFLLSPLPMISWSQPLSPATHPTAYSTSHLWNWKW